MSKEAAGVVASSVVIADLNYWQAKQKAGELREYLQHGCPLEDRPATLGSLSMLEQRVLDLSADEPHDGSLDTINAYAKAGDFKRASAEIERTGADVKLEISESSKLYHQKLNEEKAERLPILMKQLNIDEESASEFYDKHESPNRIQGRRPEILVKPK